jgi:hypothetical protein
VDETVEPVRLVVANTGPIVAAMLGECLEHLPRILSKIHIPRIELKEWKETLERLNEKLPNDKRLDIQSLIGRWTQQGILMVHELTKAQERRARELTARIHPDYAEQGKLAVDGAAVVLARTLVDLGEAQALLADERALRKCARDEGVETVGSIWLFLRMFEAGI